MRIGIIPDLNGSSGGVYQYGLTMLDALVNRSTYDKGDLVVFVHDVKHSALSGFEEKGVRVVPLVLPGGASEKRFINTVRSIIGEGPHREAWRWLRKQIQRESEDSYCKGMREWFKSLGIELMLYPYPDEISFKAQIPYVMAIHDVQHRLQPEFPEVSVNGEWTNREYLFKNACRHATLLLADSEVGREDIYNCYKSTGITADQIKVLPFLPAHYLKAEVSNSERKRVRASYSLPDRYLFYPSQFWPHKNHARIVSALGRLKRDHQRSPPIVFCGCYSGEVRGQTFKDVMALVEELKLTNQVLYLGYVPDADMSALYAEAAALIMPTFFGPTNIPVLEAWAFGCPVLTSDIRGIREQVGDAALLVDPRSIDALADGILTLWSDDRIRSSLIECGRKRLAVYTPEEYSRRLLEILEEAKSRI